MKSYSYKKLRIKRDQRKFAEKIYLKKRFIKIVTFLLENKFYILNFDIRVFSVTARTISETLSDSLEKHFLE